MIKTGWIADKDCELYEDELVFMEAVIHNIEVKPGWKRYTYDLPHLDQPDASGILGEMFARWAIVYGGAK